MMLYDAVNCLLIYHGSKISLGQPHLFRYGDVSVYNNLLCLVDLTFSEDKIFLVASWNDRHNLDKKTVADLQPEEIATMYDLLGLRGALNTISPHTFRILDRREDPIDLSAFLFGIDPFLLS
jgi:hypothetical protein